MERETFEQTKAFEVFKNAYLKLSVGDPSINISLKRKPQPYQKDIIKLITNGKIKKLQLIPMRPTSSPKHTDFIKKLIEENKDVCNEAFLNAITSGGSIIEFNPKHRPMMMIIDDPYMPHRSETK